MPIFHILDWILDSLRYFHLDHFFQKKYIHFRMGIYSLGRTGRLVIE
jgi:hypothetical protein